MVGFGRGISEAGGNIFGFEVRVVFQDFLGAHSGRQQVEHVLYANAHPPNAGAAAALVEAKSDAVTHTRTLSKRELGVKVQGFSTILGCGHCFDRGASR